MQSADIRCATIHSHYGADRPSHGATAGKPVTRPTTTTPTYEIVMDSEDAIIGDYLEGPLSHTGAIHRLMALDMSEDDAYRLLNEAVEAYEADNGQFGMGA